MRALFQQDAWLGLRTALLILLSLVLMVTESRYDQRGRLRASLSHAIMPLQYVVDAPFTFASWVSTTMSGKQALQKQNAHLEAEQLSLRARLQRFEMLQKENEQLRSLLQRTATLESKLLVARLLAVRPGLLKQEIIIDAGHAQGVFEGQPVLDAFGVMGQVIEVYQGSARVLLVSDAKSGIPVQNTRTGYRAIAEGTGYSDHMKLLHIKPTADFREGDLLVTSGLGGRFPVGYPLAIVSQVKQKSQQRFKMVLAKPKAHIDRSRDVVLIWQRASRHVVKRSHPKTVVAKKAGGH